MLALRRAYSSMDRLISRQRIWVLVLLMGTLASCETAGGSAQPCVVWTEQIRPLTVGDTARVVLGQLQVTDCVPGETNPFQWSTSDSAVVEIAGDGLLRGRAPGVFQVTASRDTVVLHESGFVLPRGWTHRILPESATVNVGDTISFRVVAYDTAGRELPPVPFSLLTPEFERPGSGELPLVDKYSHQQITVAGTFKAVRPGHTTITGVVAGRRVPAALYVVARDSTP